MGNCLFCQSSGGSQCCAIWSGMSIIFLVFVGIVMSTPPVFVKEFDDEKAAIAASNAYKVAALYGLTFLLSLYMYYYRLRQEKRAAGGLGSVGSVGGGGRLAEPLVDTSANSPAISSSAMAVGSASDAGGGGARSRRKKTTGGASDVI